MKKQSFNKGWTFRKDGEVVSVPVTLPHDAMIREQRDPASVNGSSTGYFPGGKYLYEKKFTKEDVGCGRAILDFEGVYRKAEVLLNGEKVASCAYGYSEFFADLTGKLTDGENTLQVIADNSACPNSRWYSGSGIYRPVWLYTGGNEAVAPRGLKVSTVSLQPATIHVETALAGTASELNNETAEGIGHDAAGPNSSAASVRITVLDGDTVVATGEGFSADLTIPGAKLWSAETPHLYTVRAEVLVNGEIRDTAEVTTGIRMLAWNAEQGFCVNGTPVKLAGGCLHHDHGILGAEGRKESEYRRVKRMKEYGFNAIRNSHNPASEDLLAACDELGMYLFDETFDQWKIPQTTYDYAADFDTSWNYDLTALVDRDFNHPSVILYCIGNEIPDLGLPFGPAIAGMLCDKLHELDKTRPLTIAVQTLLAFMAQKQAEAKAKAAASAKENAENSEGNASGDSSEKPEEKKGASSQDVNDILTLLPKIMASITPESAEALIGGCLEKVDIIGYNYAHNLYEGTHALKPDRVIVSSETFPQRMASNWKAVEDNPYVIGDFLWTAWDYLGESGVGLPFYGVDKAPFAKPYPTLTGACGSFDLIGTPEAAACYEGVLFGKLAGPYIFVRPVNHSGEAYALGRWRYSDSVQSWTWPGCEGKSATVEVYGAGTTAALLLNGSEVSRLPLVSGKAVFELPYTPGTLTAVLYREDGSVLGETSLATAGSGRVLKLSPESETMPADGESIVYVDIELTDGAGTIVMSERPHLTFSVEGPAELIAAGSADPLSEENFQTADATLWHGRALVVLRSTGEPGTVTVTAQGKGIAAGTSVTSSRM